MKLTRMLKGLRGYSHFLRIVDGYFKSYSAANIEFTRRQNDEIKILLSQILLGQRRGLKHVESLRATEFKVFSQFGDDGIIQYLIDAVGPISESFVEFGVEDYKEANTRFLMINNNWKGLVMDSSEANVERIRNDSVYFLYDLTVTGAFVTAGNINQLILDAGFSGEIGLLSIDIDGNDYWVWRAIQAITPVIVVVEYNSVLGVDRAITVLYEPSFRRREAHYSNLYYGASLLAFCDLAEEKGYSFVGCNSQGNNAYFVRRDRVRSVRALSPEEGYVCSKYKESMDRDGRFSHVCGDDRLRLIRGMKVYNTRTNQLEEL